MNIAIVGSRSFNDYKYLTEVMDKVLAKYGRPEQIISGGAKGADTLGEMYADEHNIETCILLPEWEKYGKQAGFLRNIGIIDGCDICIAFWDGASRGTKHDIELCKEKKKHLILANYKSGAIVDINWPKLLQE